MKRITIGGKEYTFEFTIEATLYDECTIKAMEVFVNVGVAQADAENMDSKKAVMTMLESMAGVPQRALTFFYAGLLEHHGTNGDGSVLSKDDAKRIATKYIAEHKNEVNENGEKHSKSWFDIYNEMTEIMVEDNFFDMIGLNDMMETATPKKKSGRPRKVTEN